MIFLPVNDALKTGAILDVFFVPLHHLWNFRSYYRFTLHIHKLLLLKNGLDQQTNICILTDFLALRGH